MNIQTILVPTDFSKHADRAFVIAIQFAQTFGAQIHLLHIYDIADRATVYEVVFPDDVDAGVRKTAIRKLEARMEQAKAAGIESSTHLVFGTPSQAIIQHAKESKADLIVMGTRGHSGIKNLLLGSVTERTLRLASCPVLTVGAEATTDT